MSAELLEPTSETAGRVAVLVREDDGTSWTYSFPPEEVENIAALLAGLLSERLVPLGDLEPIDEEVVVTGESPRSYPDGEVLALRARVEVLEQWLESERERVTQLLTQS